jgi:hypothetical protein
MSPWVSVRMQRWEVCCGHASILQVWMVGGAGSCQLAGLSQRMLPVHALIELVLEQVKACWCHTNRVSLCAEKSL